MRRPALVVLLPLLPLPLLTACDGEGTGPAAGAVATVATEPGTQASIVRTGPPPKTSGPLQLSPGGIRFGEIPPGSRHAAELSLRNLGPDPITITAVQSTCFCTVPEDLEGKVIPPGGSIPLGTAFEAPTQPGPKVSKVLLRFSYGGKQGHLLFDLESVITMAVAAEPPFADALEGKRTGRVHLRSQDGRPFRILSSNLQAPVYADGFDSSAGAPRNAYDVQWTIDYPAREEDCGRQRLWWVIETDHTDCPILPLEIRHECTGLPRDPDWEKRNWIFQEYLVNLGAVQAGRSVEVDVGIRNWDSVPIHAVESLTPDATAELVSTDDPPGETTTCRVRFTPRKGFQGVLYAPVNFKSERGDMDVAFLVKIQP